METSSHTSRQSLWLGYPKQVSNPFSFQHSSQFEFIYSFLNYNSEMLGISETVENTCKLNPNLYLFNQNNIFKLKIC